MTSIPRITITQTYLHKTLNIPELTVSLLHLHPIPSTHQTLGTASPTQIPTPAYSSHLTDHLINASRALSPKTSHPKIKPLSVCFQTGNPTTPLTQVSMPLNRLPQYIPLTIQPNLIQIPPRHTFQNPNQGVGIDQQPPRQHSFNHAN